MRRLIPLARRGPETKRSRRGAPRPPRRRARAMPERRLRRRVAPGLAASALLLGAGWLWHGGLVGRGLAEIRQAVLAASAEAGLKVDDVLVEGRTRTRRSAILEALGVARDLPILGFDPHAARRRLEHLPWVRAAMVERRLPALIYVRLAERTPLALWQHNGRLAVIDDTGAVIAGASPEAFARLPLVVGEDAPRHASDLLAMLDSEPELRPLVSAAVRVRGRRWNVRLDGGIDVRLPEQDPAAAWAQLARIQREHGVLARDVIMIDLRMPDRLVVRTAPGAALEGGRDPAGEDT